MSNSFRNQGQMMGNGFAIKMLALFVMSAMIIIWMAFVGAKHIYGYTAVRGTITVKSGRARKEPSANSAMVFGVIKDETVTIVGEEKGSDGKTWYKVKVMNSVGYLRSDLVKKTNIVVKSESTPDDTSSASSNVNNKDANANTENGVNAGNNTPGTTGPCVKGSNVIVREEATTKSGVRTVVQNGMPLTVISTSAGEGGKDWHYVSFKKNENEFKGYIRSDLVNLNGNVSQSEDANATNDSSSSNANSSSTDNKSPQVGKIKGTGVNIRQTPVDGKIICRLTTGNQITVTDQVKADGDGQIWYAISFIFNKTPQTGYVRSDLTEGINTYESLLKNEENKEEQPDGNQNNTEKPEENEEEKKEEEQKPSSETTSSIKGIGVRIREQAVSGNIVTQLDTGYPIEILEETEGSDGYKWYKIKFSKNDKERQGYVRSDLVSIVKADYQNQLSDEDFENQISEFPDTYKASLRALHEKYPNWQFVPVNTGLEWSDVVANESKVGKNLVAKTSIASWKSTAPQAYNWATNSWYGFDGGSWAAASTELIQYYLDPRNFLDDSGIFQFETLGFEDYQNKDGVQNVLSGSFMSGEYSDTDGETRSYAQTFYDAGKECGVNPYHLASKAIQEQGALGKSQSVAGNVGGLENLFNYFNIGAYATNGRTATINGLYYAAGSEEAYLRPWNSRYRSIVGSAKYIADKYVAVGQNTLYFQKFNVVNSKNGIYSHQYMSNVVAASYESARMRKAYSDLNTKLVFRIPYYKNMPGSKCIKPTSDSNPNTYLSDLWVEGGYTFTSQFSPINSTYYLTVGSDVTSITIGASAVSTSSSVGGTGVYSLNQGENRIQVVCKAQNGATKGYTIIVTRQ